MDGIQASVFVILVGIRKTRDSSSVIVELFTVWRFNRIPFLNKLIRIYSTILSHFVKLKCFNKSPSASSNVSFRRQLFANFLFYLTEEIQMYLQHHLKPNNKSISQTKLEDFHKVVTTTTCHLILFSSRTEFKFINAQMMSFGMIQSPQKL